MNQRIREMAARFASTVADDTPQEYVCECGCGAWVALTGSEFDTDVAAQRPVTAAGHLVARLQVARHPSRTLQRDAAALRAEALQKWRKSEELATRRKPPSGSS